MCPGSLREMEIVNVFLLVVSDLGICLSCLFVSFTTYLRDCEFEGVQHLLSTECQLHQVDMLPNHLSLEGSILDMYH